MYVCVCAHLSYTGSGHASYFDSDFSNDCEHPACSAFFTMGPATPSEGKTAAFTEEGLNISSWAARGNVDLGLTSVLIASSRLLPFF